ncbi:MAG: 23S rRNA (guanosine2251-2'-O)-methyltransferase [Alteromonas naphthalenivorans]|jgi:23S rRNA (guanosine2251-2'-O)-methyltransferase
MAKTIKKKMVAGDIIYGVHPVVELLKQKRRKVLDVFMLNPEPKIWMELRDMLPKYPVRIHKMSKESLNQRLGTTDHQGIGAFAQQFPFRKKFFEPKKQPFLLLLDGVQDVRNFGAIVRSAYCTGVNGIIICRRKGAPLRGASLKASAGLVERMEIYETSSVGNAIQELKDAGYNLYVAALSKKANAFTIQYKKPLCLIIGSEGTGVSSLALKSGTVVTLPQKSTDVSYNASVAAGILLSVISQQS